MSQTLKKFLKHACQHCRAERKLVETIIDDEFCWDYGSRMYVPNGYTNDFEHTGSERCAECGEDWTGG